jgi:predicted ATP-dependent serine protease
MPASLKLHETFKNKPVVFIYISLDENLEKWKVAAKKEGINNKSSYILPNPRQAEIIKTMKLQSIPRYMIINKLGKIISEDAPSPDDKQLSSLIESLLK